MASFVNVCRFTAASSGTGDFVVSAAVTGYQTPASAGATNGATYRYRAESSDLSQWEVGYGAYTSGSVTLARTTVLSNSSGTTSKINFSAAPQVAIVALAEDLIYSPVTPQGRLTLATGTPVMTSSQSAKTTIYYTPYAGNLIPIYDGASFRNVAFSEISVATTDTTKNPAAIGASKVNDWFVWDDAGTTRISHGPDWTSDTARSAGTALVLVNGIWLNNAAITNGPGASRGTYVGTTRSDGSSQLNWILPVAGTAGNWAVWNMYNRVFVAGSAAESTASWTYSSATVRASNGGTAARIQFVMGLAEDNIACLAYQGMNTAASAGAFGTFGMALDSTTTRDRFTDPSAAGSASLQASYTVPNMYAPQLGYHYVSHVEAGDGSTTTTYVGAGRQALTLITRM